MTLIGTERGKFHQELLRTVLTRNAAGVASNADKDSRLSRDIAGGIADQLQAETADRLAGQSSGDRFEVVCGTFLDNTFPQLQHLRPGHWQVQQVRGRGRLHIAKYQQYAHLTALQEAAKRDPELAAALGNDYVISPDIVVSRQPVSLDRLNAPGAIVGPELAVASSLCVDAQSLPILHASVSCKWTIRSDRAQNARSEAQNLIRNRKGPLPHIVVVTAEPLPSRISSLAMGTGDVDCVYHFALPELRAAVADSGSAEAVDMLAAMVAGQRLRDIADLPLDLAV